VPPQISSSNWARSQWLRGFAVGIAYSSIWYPLARQGTVLGVFGMGNAGAAVTTLVLDRSAQDSQMLVLPTSRGTTRVEFQANVCVISRLIF